MNVTFSNTFNKSISKTRDKKIFEQVVAALKTVKHAETLNDIPNIKKLKGYPNAYRIRIGDYRIGFFAEVDHINIAVFEHRKNIYKKFP